MGDIQKCLYVPPFPAVPYQRSPRPSVSVKPSTKYDLHRVGKIFFPSIYFVYNLSS